MLNATLDLLFSLLVIAFYCCCCCYFKTIQANAEMETRKDANNNISSDKDKAELPHHQHHHFTVAFKIG